MRQKKKYYLCGLMFATLFSSLFLSAIFTHPMDQASHWGIGLFGGYIIGLIHKSIVDKE